MRWLLIALAACGDNLHRFDAQLELADGCRDIDLAPGPFLAVDYTLYNDTRGSTLSLTTSVCLWASVEAFDANGAPVERGLACAQFAYIGEPTYIVVEPGQTTNWYQLPIWDVQHPTPLPDGTYTLRFLDGDGGVSNTITVTMPGCQP